MMLSSAQQLCKLCRLFTNSRSCCRDQDPAVVKLQKRLLAIATLEEDYERAAQLRDSPIMTMYRQIQELQSQEKVAEALSLQMQLDQQAAEWADGNGEHSA